ncbi:hypothetical protein M433DRAFT_156744 [Acidomyces richmondensis BFW]|nr:MAG: hypothetical protein FE78DRAFT_85369 [Acidomyces sp. 'richmondensis']KYG43449.1 hypothetical protein M433DRAFT_156744 [Acidomyces richmondensis BFW]
MVRQSNSKVSFAKLSLTYPIFAADFDPYGRGYLMVGGGGGESKTGVKNHLTLIDVSNRAVIRPAADIELSSSEDSVQSLANLGSKDGLITLAGINSSQAEQDAGKNEHLRSFDVIYPPRKKQRTNKSDIKMEEGRIQPIGKTSLFKPSTAAKKETYQRLLRLSPAQKRDTGSKRIGAVATGLAQNSEIVVFNATNPTPDANDILARIGLPERSEAADLDISEPSDSEFSLAYCTDYDVYEQTYKYDFKSRKVDKTPTGPRRIYQMPFPDSFEDPKSRPKFRSLRFLDSYNLVALSNKPSKGGAQLRIIHLYPTGPAMVMLEKILPSHIKQAVSMDVCILDADKAGNRQVVVAVAGQDISIEVYTTNYQAHTDTFSPFGHYLTLRNVHEHQITKICFSNFHSPAQPTKSQEAKAGPIGEQQQSTTPVPTHAAPQYIQLASVSYGNTVVVDTFPLSPLEPTNKQSRYVLSYPNEETWMKVSLFGIVSLIVLVLAFLVQSFNGGFAGSTAIGPFNILPQNVRNFLDQPAVAARGFGRGLQASISSGVDALPTAAPFRGRLQKLINEHLKGEGDGAPSTQALVVRDSPDGTDMITVDVHADKEAYMKEDTEAKHWDELSDEQKARWKAKLMQAGEWVEGQGEKVLIGVLFREYAGIVGAVAKEAIAG